tara:strand:- start:522 stop:716 length:195 start_codon:yes stop_codon:yes gene_type:complete
MSSIPSPQNDERGCLCPDGETYSKKCCDGSHQAQGIGSITIPRSFILLEDANYLLQEDNNKINL